MRKSKEMQEWLTSEKNKHKCLCGCGQFVTPTVWRWYRDKTLKFIPGHQNRGKFHPNYKGGKVVAKGYNWTLLQGHPRSTPRGYVKTCWLVAEKRLGRFLRSTEHVHHTNGNKLDDRPSNLEVLDHRDHHRTHSYRRKRDNNGRFK